MCVAIGYRSRNVTDMILYALIVPIGTALTLAIMDWLS
jgi:hypothetical protein